MKMVAVQNGIFSLATLSANLEAPDIEEIEVIGSTIEELAAEADG